MTPTDRTTSNGRESSPADRTLPRRRFLALGTGAGVAAVAGCAADPTPGTGGGTTPTEGSGSAGSTTTGSDAGRFRLLISDQPVAIDEFDELNVAFDRARIFRESEVEQDEAGDDEEEMDEAEEPEREDEETDEEGEETDREDDETQEDGGDDDTGRDAGEAQEADGETDREEADEADRADDEAEAEDGDGAEGDSPADDDPDGGFKVIDLGGATVDLTQVVGERAIGVFDGELRTGRYTKIELYAADVEGIVDGEPVDVKIPSGKLQIVKPFEVVAGETISFVFDINVVKKGRSGGYNLLPVISGSGVAGEDVEVEEVGRGRDGGTTSAAPADGTSPEGGADDEAGRERDEDGGRPEDAGGTPADSGAP